MLDDYCCGEGRRDEEEKKTSKGGGAELRIEEGTRIASRPGANIQESASVS